MGLRRGLTRLDERVIGPPRRPVPAWGVPLNALATGAGVFGANRAAVAGIGSPTSYGPLAVAVIGYALGLTWWWRNRHDPR